jgi:hypothetical protein
VERLLTEPKAILHISSQMVKGATVRLLLIRKYANRLRIAMEPMATGCSIDLISRKSSRSKRASSMYGVREIFAIAEQNGIGAP